MSTGTITPYRPDMRIGRNGFAQLLRAEWTKFKTVRRWGIGLMAASPERTATRSGRRTRLWSTVSLALSASSW